MVECVSRRRFHTPFVAMNVTPDRRTYVVSLCRMLTTPLNLQTGRSQGNLPCPPALERHIFFQITTAGPALARRRRRGRRTSRGFCTGEASVVRRVTPRPSQHVRVRAPRSSRIIRFSSGRMCFRQEVFRNFTVTNI